MTTKPLFLLCSLAMAAGLRAAPLAGTTAVQTQPDAASPIITYLKAGSEPTASPDSIAIAPAGWMAVVVPGPFEGYVENKDLTKSLEVKPGSAIRLAPQVDAGVLTAAEKSDSIMITGLRGKWTQVKLDKKIVGFIHMGPIASAPSSGMQDVGSSAPAATPAPTGGPGHEVASSADSSALPRFFDGVFASSRKPLMPRRPYDWQLNGPSGEREGYVDMTRLPPTEQAETYVGQEVQVYGAIKAVPGSKDFVIMVESIHLK